LLPGDVEEALCDVVCTQRAIAAQPFAFYSSNDDAHIVFRYVDVEKMTMID
jgi:hypothetical protein